jgi:ergothioneine biosynthesis protein EgtB
MAYTREYFSELENTLNWFLSVRRTTEDLCHPLHEEDYLLSVTTDTSPPKWHLAHTTWFFENFVLKRLDRNYGPYRNEYSFLFNSYHREMGINLVKEKRNVLSRPSVKEIYQYRRIITQRVIDKIHSLTEKEFADVFDVFELGIHHEQQHQEILLMDIKRNFFENPLRPKYVSDHSPAGHQMPEAIWHNIPSGLAQIGVSKKSITFSFDNEMDIHNQWIESCMMSSHLVSNDEYAAFIDHGGYDNPLLWHSDGWDLKQKENWTAPLYWEKDGREWWVFSHGGMIPLDLGAPVAHVSFYEASAFAKWKGARLPTEFEWETAAKMEEPQGAFLEGGSFDPGPPLDDHQQFSQIHGTLWEWTQSAYLPYPRYEKYQRGLAEYNEKFMVNQFVMRGGSCLTPKNHYRITYRNFYYPHMRWQYGGIRLAKDLV